MECCKCKIIISRDTFYIMSKMHRGWECQDIVNILILIQDTEATTEAMVITEVEAMAAIMEELQAATARITATAVLRANTGEFTVNY